jgi:hypothetical protein
MWNLHLFHYKLVVEKEKIRKECSYRNYLAFNNGDNFEMNHLASRERVI